MGFIGLGGLIPKGNKGLFRGESSFLGELSTLTRTYWDPSPIGKGLRYLELLYVKVMRLKGIRRIHGHGHWKDGEILLFGPMEAC